MCGNQRNIQGIDLRSNIFHHVPICSLASKPPIISCPSVDLKLARAVILICLQYHITFSRGVREEELCFRVFFIFFLIPSDINKEIVDDSSRLLISSTTKLSENANGLVYYQ